MTFAHKLLGLTCLLGATACYDYYGYEYVPVGTVTVTGAPVEVQSAPYVYWEGRPHYYYHHHWYFREHGHWYYYPHEPYALHEYRHHHHHYYYP